MISVGNINASLSLHKQYMCVWSLYIHVCSLKFRDFFACLSKSCEWGLGIIWYKLMHFVYLSLNDLVDSIVCI